MSRTGETKRKILDLLRQRNETLTDISNKLNVAPSTVRQHLQELMDSGLIKQIDDRPRKWKYYEINRNYAQNNVGFSMNKYILPIVVVLIVAVFAFGFYLTRSPSNSVNGLSSASSVSAQSVELAPNSAVPQGSTVFTISDAPSSYNITALYVTVDSAEIHSQTTGKWYTIPIQTSTFNLIQLKNISQVLAGVKLSNGIYDQLVLQVSNVNANVNGTNQSVYLPNNMFDLKGNFNISNNTTSSTNWINIDFNLENSLHIAANGKILMFPVLVVRHLSGNNLTVNQSTIIIARSPAIIHRYVEYGMDVNGNLVSNYTAPQNTTISATASGQYRENGVGPTPFVIRTARGLFIGGDATNLIQVTASGNSSTNSTTSGNAPVYGALIIRRCLNYPCCVVEASAQGNPVNNTSGCCTSATAKGCCISSTAANSTSSGCCQNPCCNNGILPPTSNNPCCNNGILPPGPLTNSSNATTPIAYGYCCNYGIVVPLNGGTVYRKCLPIEATAGAGSTAGVSSTAKGSISATALNNGEYVTGSGGGSASSTSGLTVGVYNSNGSITTDCVLSNGALICATLNGSVLSKVSATASGAIR